MALDKRAWRCQKGHGAQEKGHGATPCYFSLDLTLGAHAHTSQGPKSRYDGKKKFKDKQFDKCSRCGSRHGQNSACPANGQKCLKCGKLNHFKKMCRTKHVHTIDEDSDSSDEEQTLFLGCLDTQRSR